MAHVQGEEGMEQTEEGVDTGPGIRGQYEIGSRRVCAWCWASMEAWIEYVLGGWDVFNEDMGRARGLNEGDRRERMKAVLRDWREENVSS